MADQARAAWSQTASDIAMVIGDDGLSRLVVRWGGARLNVPPRPKPESDLAAVLGDAYLPFQAAFAGCPLDIPLLAPSAVVSDAAILAELSAGLSADRIAPRYRISRRRVFRIRARSTPSTTA